MKWHRPHRLTRTIRRQRTLQCYSDQIQWSISNNDQVPLASIDLWSILPKSFSSNRILRGPRRGFISGGHRTFICLKMPSLAASLCQFVEIQDGNMEILLSHLLYIATVALTARLSRFIAVPFLYPVLFLCFIAGERTRSKAGIARIFICSWNNKW
jgi:hypothetical protein